jgi:hypothetical protein
MLLLNPAFIRYFNVKERFRGGKAGEQYVLKGHGFNLLKSRAHQLWMRPSMQSADYTALQNSTDR